MPADVQSHVRRRGRTGLIAALAIVATGCGTANDAPVASPTPEPSVSAPPPPPMSEPPESPPPTAQPPRQGGDVPEEYLTAAIADAAERADTEPAQVDVTRATAMRWPDGSLGCPQPGQVYTQAIVEGYHIELRVRDRTYDYRLDEQGNLRLCTEPIVSPRPG